MKTITKNYNLYGGDFERVLSIRKAPDGEALMLCLQTHHGEVCRKITSSPEYKQWLLTKEDLLSCEEEDWFNDRINGGSRYKEFGIIGDWLEAKALEEDNISF